MIPVIDLCWQRFDPARVAGATVDDLYTLAIQHGAAPFVVHDSMDRTSALVLPETVTMAVDQLGLPLWASASDIGLFDAIRRNQMTVSHDQPASLVVRLASSQKVGAVIAVNQHRVPVGLLIPGSVIERLPASHWVVGSSPALQQQIAHLAAGGDLVGAIAALEAEYRFDPGEFHSESLNEYASDAYTCAGDFEDGAHTVYRCPCEVHIAGVCAKRKVANI